MTQNKSLQKKEDNDFMHLFAFLVLSAFLLLKVYRGFSGVSAESSGGIWNVIQIFFIMWGFVYMFQDAARIFTNGSIVSLVIFSTIAFLFALTAVEAGDTKQRIFNIFMVPYGAMMTIVFFQIGARYSIRKNRTLIVSYYAAAFILIAAMARFYNSGANLEDKGAVADAYYILGMFPLILAYTSKKWIMLPIVVCSVTVAFSGKRAGLLALAVILSIYFFTAISKTNMHLLKRIGLFVVIAIAVIALYNLLLYVDSAYNMRLFERMESLSSDGGSGRDRIWARTISSLREFNVLELLTGKGKGSVREIVGIQAHNDFLSVMHEHGIFSMLFYIVYFILLIRDAISMYRNKYPYAHLFLMSVVCSLFIAMFSFYIIYPTYCTGGMVCSGFFLGDYYRYKQENNLIGRKKYGGYNQRYI